MGQFNKKTVSTNIAHPGLHANHYGKSQQLSGLWPSKCSDYFYELTHILFDSITALVSLLLWIQDKHTDIDNKLEGGVA